MAIYGQGLGNGHFDFTTYNLQPYIPFSDVQGSGFSMYWSMEGSMYRAMEGSMYRFYVSGYRLAT